MHPALLLVPALGLLLVGPRLWVRRVLQANDAAGGVPATAHAVARDLLDRHGLQAVKVELTDIGDHYDPQAKAVRLSRHHFDRDSLSAVTTAAHEVAHAQQHATGYAPFVWRARLARVAQLTGQLGTVLIIAVPVTYLLTRRPLPAALVGSAALGMLGTGALAQLSALPTELDASFRRALPMLQDGYIDDDQVEAAHRILFACSLTYVASSLVGVLHIWPWLGGGRMGARAAAPALPPPQAATTQRRQAQARARRAPGRLRGGAFEAALRRVAKPLLRGLLTVTHAQH